MGLRQRLDSIRNPWLASAIVFSAFVLFTILCFGTYWLLTGGRERMVSPTTPASSR